MINHIAHLHEYIFIIFIIIINVTFYLRLTPAFSLSGSTDEAVWFDKRGQGFIRCLMKASWGKVRGQRAKHEVKRGKKSLKYTHTHTCISREKMVFMSWCHQRVTQYSFLSSAESDQLPVNL